MEILIRIHRRNGPRAHDTFVRIPYDDPDTKYALLFYNEVLKQLFSFSSRDQVYDKPACWVVVEKYE